MSAFCLDPTVLAGYLNRAPIHSANLLYEKILTEKYWKDILPISLPHEVIVHFHFRVNGLNPGTENQGVGDYTMCISLFLCPKSVLSKLKSTSLWWGGLSVQLLDAAVQTDFLSHRPKIEPLRGGLQLNQGVAIMRNYAQVPTKPNNLTKNVRLVSLFNLVKRTNQGNQGNQVIFTGLSFAQAISLINQQTPPLLIKFSRMQEASS